MHLSNTREKLPQNIAMNQLIIEIKKENDSVRRGGLYNIVIEFSITMKIVGLIKIG